MRCFSLFLCSSLGLLMTQSGYAQSHQEYGHLRFRLANIEAQQRSHHQSVLLRLGLNSQWSTHWSSTVEIDSVTALNDDQVDNGARQNGQAFLPDTIGTELNQARLNVKYQALDASIGRQRIEWDDERFLGSEDFWQNDQTFDALQLNYQLGNSSSASYIYLDRVNRIFGSRTVQPLNNSTRLFMMTNPDDHLLRGRNNHDSHLARLQWREWDYQTINLYTLRINNSDLPQTNTHTDVINYQYKQRFAKVTPELNITGAQQRAERSNTGETLYYTRLRLGLAYQQLHISAQRERLGSDGQRAFMTPLASFHDFHGWSDAWWVLPPTGIVDDRLRLQWRLDKLKFDLRWHQFQSDATSQDWGNETDLDIIYTPNKHHRASVRIANFRPGPEIADRFIAETRVLVHYQWSF